MRDVYENNTKVEEKGKSKKKSRKKYIKIEREDQRIFLGN